MSWAPSPISTPMAGTWPCAIQRATRGRSATTSWSSRWAASTNCCPFPVWPITRMVSGAWPRRCTCAITCSARSRSRTFRRTGQSGTRAAPSWWSAPAYTGTEVAASGQLLTRIAARRRPGLTGQKLRWMLLDVAPRVMPELDPRLSAIASQVLSARGLEVRTGTSVEHASADGVKLSDGEFVPTCSLIWCVGVRPDPMVARLGLPMQKGRLHGGRIPDGTGSPRVVRLR